MQINIKEPNAIEILFYKRNKMGAILQYCFFCLGRLIWLQKEFEQVKNDQKHLHDYLESDKLLVTNVQLKDLQGIAGLGK